MADLWELTKRLEDHPQDHAIRWRLAKKLYRDGDYRLALEHLQVLKNEQRPPQLNAARFLAATLYRLGRFEEAAQELRETFEQWPREVGILQQLARALEVGGQPEAAAEVWDKILQKDPMHPFAAKAAASLREASPNYQQTALRSPQSDPGLDLWPGVNCPKCQAQNSGEFERCWQCNTLLPASRLAAARQEDSEDNPGLSPDTAMRAVKAFCGLTLLCAVALSAWLLYARYGGSTPVTLDELYDNTLAWTRIGTGLGLLLFWPLAAGLAVWLTGCQSMIPEGMLSRLSIGFAGLAFLVNDLSGDKLTPILLFPGLVSFFALILLLPLPKTRAVALWAVQMILATAFGFILFAAIEWAQLGVLFNPLRDIPALRAYVRDQGLNAGKGHVVAEGACPLSGAIALEGTGSDWLDARSGHVLLSAESPDSLDGLTFELRKEGSTIIYEPVQGRRWTMVTSLDGGPNYTLGLVGAAGKAGRIEILTLLKIR